MIARFGGGTSRICVIGHRGIAGVLPENTLAGFRLAMDLGVDAVECDVHVTRDHRAVILHDEEISRTTNGTGKVADMTLEDILHLDAGGGQRIPTLDELLDLLAGRCHLFCELKARGSAVLAAEAVLAKGMQHSVTFISFSLDHLAEVKQCNADLRIGVLCASPTIHNLPEALDLGICYLGLQDRCVTPGMVKRIQQAGVAPGVWTTNSLEDMLAMMDMGVTHITTDQPDVLLRYLGRLNVRSMHRLPAGLVARPADAGAPAKLTR